MFKYLGARTGRLTLQQQARIEAAQAKRARRALTADRNAWRSFTGNPCLTCSDRHNPTHVNRSE